MSTYNFELKFAGGDVTKRDLPGAFAYIAVKHATPHGQEIMISPQCAGPNELKGQVERLKKELDDILKEGIKRFARYREQTVEETKRKHNTES